MIFKKCPECGFENPESAKFCNECGAKLVIADFPASPKQEHIQEGQPPGPTEPPPSEEILPPVETPPETSEPKPVPPADAQIAALESSTQPAESTEDRTEQPQGIPPGGIELAPGPEGNDQAPPAPSETADEPVAPAPSGVAEKGLLSETVEIPAISPVEPEAPGATSGEPSPAEPEEAFEEIPAEETSSQHPFGARFKVIEELGTGTLGTVYKVFDKAMERDQALKAVKPEISQKAEAFEGFARELKVERSIVHKNIARIFELNVLLGRPFITMEFIAGRDLGSLLKEKKRLPVIEAISIAKQLFTGLAHAHKLGAPHLDLRPENIMIDKEGTVKIMDLGITRLFRAKGIIRSSAGRPQYMSPEQLAGQEADARSDIFAAGAMLYEMLTGSLPPVGEPAKSPRELNPGVPAQLSLLALRCIEEDKEKRYQTAQEIQGELEVIETIASQAPAEAPDQRPAEKPVELKAVREQAPVAAAEQERVAVEARVQKKATTRRAIQVPRKALFPALGILALVILAIILWRFAFKPSGGASALPAQPPRLTMAVLPFEDISPAKDRQHMATALAETLIRSLGKMDNLAVSALESSSSFLGKSRDPRQVGRRLRVDHYLEGTFEEQDDRIKINARLLKADSAAPLWSGQYERGTSEVFVLQDEIARAVEKSLGLIAAPVSGSAPRQAGPVNFKALDLYAQARSLINKNGRENLENAIDLYAKAGAEDPAFTLSFAGLADAYLRLAEGHYWTPDQAIPKAKEAALKGLLIDSALAEAHTVLARIKTFYDWDFAGAEKQYGEALRLDPSQAAAHQFYALMLSALGRHREAVEESQLAQALNPLSSEVNAQAGLILFFARLYEQADAEINKAVVTDPLYPGHHLNAALIHTQMGRFEQAMSSLEEAKDLGADPMEVKLRMAHVHARQGQRREAGRLLTEAFDAPKQVYVSKLSMALVYAGLNEKDQAIAALEKALAERDNSLIFIRVHPFLDPARGDLRFVSLLQKVGLPPY